MTGRGGGAELTRLIERSGELKRDLVDFACSPRLKRSLAAAMAEAGLEEFEDADAIGIIDRFALQYRLPDGKTVVDRFVASRPDLDAADREMLLGWRDAVEGIFEIRSRDGDAIVLLNLIDDLEYRAYSNMGRVAFRSLPRDGFVHARLVPIRPVAGAWLVSGMMSSYRKSDAGWIAKAALELATKRRELVFRNRSTHAWPPDLSTVPAHWTQPFARLAEELVTRHGVSPRFSSHLGRRDAPESLSVPTR